MTETIISPVLLKNLFIFMADKLAVMVQLGMSAALANPQLTVFIVLILALCVIVLYAIHKDRDVILRFFGIFDLRIA